MRLTEEQLVGWGERIGREVGAPLFLALRGDLGAGKSVLARAVARGAGVRQAMPSPTFNLLFRYEVGRSSVVHIDLYRLERPGDVMALGWRELGAGDEIVLVEWPDRAGDLLPPDRWDITLTEAGPRLREVRMVPRGAPRQIPLPVPERET
ncbi:MAG TPA: tRNA (adenosine(37)-N6)-threonylcarbamoyltransferase complex ATPase subunit type 1 TsaE [Longimicrobiales bacterium]|nr:tRNA (adenosine(37)-N6)-threonylcarbamoyltransferase complex ATPase subunit type 1 TsaE [Longimicrobiales bacterium]